MLLLFSSSLCAVLLWFFKYPFSQLFLQPVFPLANLTYILLLMLLPLYLCTGAPYTFPHDLLAPHKYQFIKFWNCYTWRWAEFFSSLSKCKSTQRFRWGKKVRPPHLIPPPPGAWFGGCLHLDNPHSYTKTFGAWCEHEEATHLYRYGGALGKCGSPWWKALADKKWPSGTAGGFSP